LGSSQCSLQLNTHNLGSELRMLDDWRQSEHKNLQEVLWASVLLHALVWNVQELVLHLLSIPSRRNWRSKARARCNWFHCNVHVQELTGIMEEAIEIQLVFLYREF
jgi:hypothetical protein